MYTWRIFHVKRERERERERQRERERDQRVQTPNSEHVEATNTFTNVYETYARRMRARLGIRPCKEWLMGVSVAGELAGFMGRWFYERI